MDQRKDRGYDDGQYVYRKDDISNLCRYVYKGNHLNSIRITSSSFVMTRFLYVL